MTNLSNLSSLFSRYANKVRYGDRLRPHRDWWVLISIALILLLLSAGWSYWLFMLTSNAQRVQGPAVSLEPAKTSSLEAVNTIFNNRAVEKAHYLSDYRFVDPSH